MRQLARTCNEWGSTDKLSPAQIITAKAKADSQNPKISNAIFTTNSKKVILISINHPSMALQDNS